MSSDCRTILTATSWHRPTALGSCRPGRLPPAGPGAHRRSAFSGQPWCPWSAAAASQPHSRCWRKTWIKKKGPAGSFLIEISCVAAESSTEVLEFSFTNSPLVVHALCSSLAKTAITISAIKSPKCLKSLNRIRFDAVDLEHCFSRMWESTVSLRASIKKKKKILRKSLANVLRAVRSEECVQNFSSSHNAGGAMLEGGCEEASVLT